MLNCGEYLFAYIRVRKNEMDADFATVPLSEATSITVRTLAFWVCRNKNIKNNMYDIPLNLKSIPASLRPCSRTETLQVTRSVAG